MKNRNSHTWVLVALTVCFTYPVLHRVSAETRAGEWERPATRCGWCRCAAAGEGAGGGAGACGGGGSSRTAPSSAPDSKRRKTRDIGEGGGETGAAQVGRRKGRKPFKSWSVSEVCELVGSIGSAFADNAAAMQALGIDGDFLSEMLDANDKDLAKSPAEGGLGFTSLKLKRLRAAIATLK